MLTAKARLKMLKVFGAVLFLTSLMTGAIAHEGHEEGADADVEIVLGEMYIRPAGGEPGDAIHVEGGRLNLIRVVNEGHAEHELHFGVRPDPDLNFYQENLFGHGGEHAAHGFQGVVLAPGQSAQLHVWIPEDRKGDWELGCFIPGHYEAGQKAVLLIE